MAMNRRKRTTLKVAGLVTGLVAVLWAVLAMPQLEAPLMVAAAVATVAVQMMWREKEHQ